MMSAGECFMTTTAHHSLIDYCRQAFLSFVVVALSKEVCIILAILLVVLLAICVMLLLLF
jgi:hypothetical protein